MKKAIIIGISTALIFSLAGCANNESSSAASSTAVSSTVAASTAAAASSKSEEATPSAESETKTEEPAADSGNFWEKPGSGKTIGLTVISFSSGAWNDLANACHEYTREGDTLVDLSFDEDSEELARIMEDFVAKDYDAIVFTAHDPDAVKGAMDQANEANIPLFNIDSPAEDQSQVVTYIGQDNYDAAFQAGEIMAKALNYEGKVAEWGSSETAVAVALKERAQGFEDAIAQYDGMEIVANPETPWPWQVDNAMSTVEATLQAHPEIQGIFVPADILLDGIVQAFEGAEIANPAIVSLSTHDNYYLIEQGSIAGIVDIQYDVLGKTIMENVYKYLDGDTDLEPIIYSPVKMVDKDNVNG